MNANTAIWLGAALLIAGLAVFLAVRLQPARRNALRSGQGWWFLAAGTSAMTLLSIAATVVQRLPDATVIDIGAVAVTGILTGLFLGFGLARHERLPINRGSA